MSPHGSDERTPRVPQHLPTPPDRPDADDPERGDVPGWVLVTLMTAGLVVALWAIAGPLLENAFTQAISSVTGR
ncbi:hypothetical protein [Puerhibacterium sp. TATVAM-FAB25]|uniref:hypothetical protein n=1 Tax=Puerhibacterium sp. TATVAM-FAB25 TaxID=3093699 RepID=UPI00397B0ED1